MATLATNMETKNISFVSDAEVEARIAERRITGHYSLTVNGRPVMIGFMDAALHEFHWIGADEI